MKRLLVEILFIPLVITCIFLYKTTAYAQTQDILSASTEVNLSDAIYADLAVRGYLDNVSLYYTDGKAVDTVMVNETRHWLPASTVKTYAAMYAYKLIADGKLHSTDTVTIDAKNDVPTELVTDELPTLLIGDTVTIERLIRQMITQSDNTAFNQLLDILGRENITAYIQSLGLVHSHVGSKLNLDDSQTQYEYDVSGYGVNTTTAEDYAKAFMLIRNNRIAGSKELFAVLKDQKINNMIPLFLPKTVVCAHKTGDLDPLYHDGGICQDKTHSYVLTIFTNAGDPTLLAQLSQIVYTKNFQLVGQSLSAGSLVSEKIQPVDELVMNPPKTAVLGASTAIHFPAPEITAADLGINASDLTFVVADKNLPKVFIPADSPFHTLSDAWQIAKILIVPGPQARMEINLQTARLRLAEARELMSRGKIAEAQVLLVSVQKGLDVISKDPTIEADASDQTAIQAISETRFAILGDQLQQVHGNEKLILIKQIASQAKETIQQVQPNLPEAVNATNPTQRPLIGTVVSSTLNQITVKTAGGQEITVPMNNPAITTVEGKAFTTSVVPGENSATNAATSTPEPSSAENTLSVGSTIALVGSTVNNHFSPALIVKNVPKELAAPEPVTVAKVDTKNNTMVVEENGVYTQVDINKQTSIKGADTDIPLKSIQPGDVVVVHGAPLVQKPDIQPTITITPTIIAPTLQTQITKPAVTPTLSPAKQEPSVTQVLTPILLSPSITSTPPQMRVSPTLLPSPVKQNGAFSSPTQQPIPTVIQGMSIQIIEKKVDITSVPSPVIHSQELPKTQSTVPATSPSKITTVPTPKPLNTK